MTKTRKQRKTKQHSPEIVVAEFVPIETLMKESLKPNKVEKERRTRILKCPSSLTEKPGSPIN
jgi:hypothetical protein